MPTFLPEYYSPVFSEHRDTLILLGHSEKEDWEQYAYLTEDRTLMLSVENIVSDRRRADAMFKNLLGRLNAEMENKDGEFIEIARRELHARVRDSNVERTVFGYILPRSIQIWTYTASPAETRQIASKYQRIRTFVDIQRYVEAMREGNVCMGSYGSEIFRHAHYLLDGGNRKESLSVLQQLLPRFPFEYEAHLTLMENTADRAAAMNSARIVFQGAEDPTLIDAAADFLGIEKLTLDSFPLLDEREGGLEVILVPLPPCNPWFLEDVARAYEQIVGLPVKIRRLEKPWVLRAPERIFRQRDTQRLLQEVKKGGIDFGGWDEDRYIDELLKAEESADAMSKYHIKEWVEKIQKESGQYLVDPYLDWFSETLRELRSRDERTMYVGITQANIYSGDNNYIFSQGRIGGESKASIQSYYMMLANTLGEEYQSRQRLTERIAKELVPSSLKQLGIPRSVDPTCPYSYSSGVSRLDQKTMNLSDAVKDALERLAGRGY